MNNNICQVKQDILVTLDTRNCTTFYNDNKYSDVEWDFSDSITMPKKGVEFSVSVVNASIPIGQYNVCDVDLTEAYLYITEVGGSSWTTYASNGNYTINELITTLKANLPSRFQWTYLAYKNKIIIYNSNNVNFTIRVTKGLVEPLGLPTSGVTYTSSSNNFVFPNSVNMSGLRSINIHLDNLNTKNVSSFTKSTSTTIASIPVDVNSMGIVSYNLSCDYEIPVPISSLDFINIMLRDNQNNLIQNNGIHWSVTLKFSYYIQQEFSTETLHEKVNRQKLTIIQPKPIITEIPKIFSSRKDLETQNKKL
jgi:hypothetical protein